MRTEADHSGGAGVGALLQAGGKPPRRRFLLEPGYFGGGQLGRHLSRLK